VSTAKETASSIPSRGDGSLAALIAHHIMLRHNLSAAGELNIRLALTSAETLKGNTLLRDLYVSGSGQHLAVVLRCGMLYGEHSSRGRSRTTGRGRFVRRAQTKAEGTVLDDSPVDRVRIKAKQRRAGKRWLQAVNNK
jgi:hypothetical protein